MHIKRVRPSQLMYQTLTRLAYPLFKPKLTDVRGLEHLPRRGGYILAANHVDWLDGFYIAAAVGLDRKTPVHFLTKSNNYWWTNMTIQIPAERSEIINVAVKFLKHGKVICNFIEGQRNDGRHLLPGKTGTVRMAMAAGVPVVPVGISCSAGKTMAESLLYLFSKDHPVRLRFGAPLMFHHLDPKQLTPDVIRISTERIMAAISPLAGKNHI